MIRKRKIICLGLLIICLFSFLYIPDSFGASQIEIEYPETTNNLWEGHLYDFTCSYYNDAFYSQQYTDANLEVQFVESFNGNPHNNYSITSLDTMYNYYPDNLTTVQGVYNNEGTANLLDDDFYNISSTNNHLTYPLNSDFDFTDGVLNNYGDMSNSNSNYTIINSTYSESYALESGISITNGTLDSYGSQQYNDDISADFSSEGVAGLHRATYSFTGEAGETGTDISWVDVDDSGANSDVSIKGTLGSHNEVLNLTDGSDIFDCMDYFDNQSYGSVELWISMNATDVGKVVSLIFRNQDTNAITTAFNYLDAGTLKYNDGDSGWTVMNDSIIADTWYHLRFDFDCNSDTFDFYMNKELLIDDGNFTNDVDSIDNIKFLSYNFNDYYEFYADAIGYSWDHTMATLETFDSADTDNYYRDISSDFESEDLGDTGLDINFIDEYDSGTNCSATIYDFGDDHSYIMNMSDYSTSFLVSARNIFSEQRTTGTIEYYIRLLQTNKNVYYRIYGNDFAQRLYMYWASDGNLKYYNGTDFITIDSYSADTWYHIKIEFDCNTDWHLWIDGVSMDSGSGYEYEGSPTYFYKTYWFTSTAQEEVEVYIDAVGYSWDTEYTIGENLIYEPKVPSGWSEGTFYLDDQLSTAYVNSTIGSNSNVFVVQDEDTAGQPVLYNYFTTTEAPILEFMFGKSTIGGSIDYLIRFWDSSGMVMNFVIVNDDLLYHDGVGYHNIKLNFIAVDTMYHVRIVGNSTHFDTYIDGILEYSNAPYNHASTTINKLTLQTYYGESGISCYFDNFTYSTSANYPAYLNYYKTNATIDLNWSINISQFTYEDLKLFYALNNSAGETTYVYLFNFSSSEWVLINSTDFTTSLDNILYLNSSFYNGTYNILLRFYINNNNNSFSLSLDRLTVMDFKNIDFTMSVSLSEFIDINNLTLVYSFNTSISQLLNFSIYNFTSSSWLELNSSIFDDFIYQEYFIGPDFLNSSYNILFRFELTNNTYNYSLYIDQFRITELSYLNITTVIECGSALDLLEMQISSYYHTDISQTVNFSIYCYGNSSWVLMNSSINFDDFYESLFIYNGSNLMDFFNDTRYVMLRWYAVNYTNTFDLYNDFIQLKTYTKLYLSYSVSFNLLGVWRYRWNIIDNLYASDWIYFDVIPPESNIKMISESDKLTEWEFLSTDYTEIDLYDSDFTSEVWSLYDVSEENFTATDYTNYIYENINIEEWEIDKYEYDGVSINPHIYPAGIFFKPDGTKMYELSIWTGNIHQWNLTTAWDISTASDSGITESCQDSQPEDVFFKPDGTKMYELGRNQHKIYQYSLSSAWDLSTASYDSISASLGSGTQTGLFFKPDGTKLYIADDNGDVIKQYSLSSAWDLSTISFDTSKNSHINIEDLFIKSDGLKLYEVRSDRIYQYTMSVAWDLTTLSYDNIYLRTQGAGDTQDAFFKPDGMRLFESGGRYGDNLFQWDLGVLVYKENNSRGYMYLQTDTNEILSVRSENMSLTLQENDRIEIMFNTTSENRIDINLLNLGIEQDSYIMNQQDNQNFNNRTSIITIQNNNTINKIEFSGLFEDTKNLNIHSIRIYRLNATGTTETYSVEPQGNDMIFIDFVIELEVNVYEDNILVETFLINSSQSLQVLVYEKINTQSIYITFYDSNNEYLNFNNFQIYVNYTLQEIEYLNKRLIINQFFADVESTFDYKIYDSFDYLIASDTDQNIQTFVDITLNVFELKIKNEAYEYINYTLTNSNTLSEKEGLLLPQEIKYFYIASNNYTLEYLNYEDGSNNTYSFEFINNKIIIINSTYFDIYFSLFNFDGLGLDPNLFRFYINNERKDLGFNTMTQDTNNLLVKDFFNSTLFNSNVNLRPYTEYNINVQVYTLILNNNYTHSIYIEIERNNIEIKQIIPAQAGISYRFLPNVEYEIRWYYINGSKIDEMTLELEDNFQVVSFGFYSTEVPIDPTPIIFSYQILFYFALGLFIIIIIGIIIFIRLRSKSEEQITYQEYKNRKNNKGYNFKLNK